ncbi:MAG TPA: NAD-dependent succinate-semialdehyde dehydrogenase [Xanthobacteraceae bacterium]|nr:NAD-dependent succinate-semialdehyde dehydrogenase [Xanthobacteraceae bacterium]
MSNASYGSLGFYINGEWINRIDGPQLEVCDPATGEVLAPLPRATAEEMDRAAEAANAAFPLWRAMTALDRSRILRKAADLIRERVEHIAQRMTREQGKPLAQARIELMIAADTFDWCAEEGRRIYGRLVPSPVPDMELRVTRQPVGPVAAFTPWNLPAMMPARKIGAALASGCTVVIKPAEETPATALEIARALHDAGLPKGVVNVVFGIPDEVSRHLIAHPAIRKITFTGSTVVGQHLAKLASDAGVKRCTMELGGHAPVLILDDADIEKAVSVLVPAKFRNAGQICISPTRFYVHDSLHDRFVDQFTAATNRMVVGNGLDAATNVGPLANSRRLSAMDTLIGDAVSAGGRLNTGGERIGNRGNFFQPTVVADVPMEARIMNEEPFGPVAVTARFSSLDEVIAQANRLPFGLAAYAFTSAVSNVRRLSEEVEAGLLGINTVAVSHPEAPFGGVKMSGYGSEGGIEGMDPYLVTKLVAVA